jgi:hypothetical protein
MPPGALRSHMSTYSTAVIDFESYLRVGRSPRTGVFVLADSIHRQLPTSFDPITHESIHPSVLMQGAIPPQLAKALATHSELICQLMPLEQQAKQQWPYAPGNHSHWNGVADVIETEVVNEVTVVRRHSFIYRAVKSLRRRPRDGDRTVQSKTTGISVQRPDSTASLTAGERSWLLRLMQETSVGDFIRDLV